MNYSKKQAEREWDERFGKQETDKKISEMTNQEIKDYLDATK